MTIEGAAQVGIGLGAALITLIEPLPGHEASYNRWYEEDHVYATLAGPRAIAGARFVARGQDKARRFVAAPLDPERGAFLAVYWFDGDGAEHRQWRTLEAKHLEAAGRIYRERDYVFGFDARLAFSQKRQPDGVPAVLALDHRFGHLGMTVIEPSPDRPAEESAEAYVTGCLPGLLQPGSPIDLCVGFVAARATQARERRDPDEVVVPADLVVLWFCETDPTAQWSDLVEAQAEGAAAAGLGRIVWVSPFVATVVGTDTYLDQL
jgi:hypothetical protein